MPALQRHIRQQVGRCLLAGRRIQIESRHQRHIDDATAQVRFRNRQLFGSQRAQRIVLITTTHGDTHDGHASLACFVHQPVGIASTEQFAEQYEHIALAEDVGLRDVA